MKKIFAVILILMVVINVKADEDDSSKQREDLKTKISAAPRDTSKVNLLSKLARLYPQGSDERLQYLHEGLDLAEKLNYQDGIVVLNYNISSAHAAHDSRAPSQDYTL